MNTRRTLCIIAVIFVVLLSFETCTTTETALPDVTGETWDYVILGSSIGTWWARCCYGALMESDLGVKILYHDYYVGSQPVSSLLYNVINNERLREDIRKAEVITIGVGSADMFNAIRWHDGFNQSDRRQLEQAVEVFRETYNSMLSEVVSLASPTGTIIRIMDFYFPYVGRYKEKGIYSITKQYWMKFNECIIQAGRQHSIPVALVFEAFNGPLGDDDPADNGYLDYDGKHSSLKGLKLIAEKFHNLGYQHALR